MRESLDIIIIVVSSFLFLLFLILMYLRLFVRPAAIRNNKITGNAASAMISGSHKYAIAPISVLAVTSLILFQLHIIRGNQVEAGRNIINSRVEGVSDFNNQLNEISLDLSRFDQGDNVSVRVHKITEQIDIYDDHYNFNAVLVIKKRNGICVAPVVRYEIGRFTRIKDIKLDLSYEKEGEIINLDEEDYQIIPRKLISKEVGCLSIKLDEKYLNENEELILKMKFVIPREEIIDPFYFLYFNPQDYGEESIELDITINYNFEISTPRFLDFDKEKKGFLLPMQSFTEKLDWEFKENTLKLKTSPSKRLRDSVLIIVERVGFPKSFLLNAFSEEKN